MTYDEAKRRVVAAEIADADACHEALVRPSATAEARVRETWAEVKAARAAMREVR